MRRVIPLLLTTALCGCFDLAPAETSTSSGTSHGVSTGATGDPPSTTGEGKPDFDVAAGEGVTVSGSIKYKGDITGKIRVDVLAVKEKQMFELVMPIGLTDYGDWSFEAPKNFGELRIIGFVDQTGDGPSQDDAAMVWPDPIGIGGQNIDGIDLVLKENPDLTELAPASLSEVPPPPPPEDPNAEETAGGEGGSGDEGAGTDAGDTAAGDTEGAPAEGGEAPPAE